MTRNMAIWTFGLIAAGVAGGTLGESHGYDGAVWGVLWGVVAFICVRMWIGVARTRL